MNFQTSSIKAQEIVGEDCNAVLHFTNPIRLVGAQIHYGLTKGDYKSSTRTMARNPFKLESSTENQAWPVA